MPQPERRQQAVRVARAREGRCGGNGGGEGSGGEGVAFAARAAETAAASSSSRAERWPSSAWSSPSRMAAQVAMPAFEAARCAPASHSRKAQTSGELRAEREGRGWDGQKGCGSEAEAREAPADGAVLEQLVQEMGEEVGALLEELFALVLDELLGRQDRHVLPPVRLAQFEPERVEVRVAPPDAPTGSALVDFEDEEGDGLASAREGTGAGGEGTPRASIRSGLNPGWRGGVRRRHTLPCPSCPTSVHWTAAPTSAVASEAKVDCSLPRGSTPSAGRGCIAFQTGGPPKRLILGGSA